MKQKYLLLIVLCIAMLILSSCSSNALNLLDIKPGMTRTEIESKYGKPVDTNEFKYAYQYQYPLTINGVKGKAHFTFESKDPSAPIRPYWSEGNTSAYGIEWFAEPKPYAEGDTDEVIIAEALRDEEKVRQYLKKTIGDHYEDLCYVGVIW